MAAETGRRLLDDPVSSDVVRRRGLELGLAAVGVAPAEIAEPARTVLGLRKEAGLAGAMQFTYRNPERSTDPSNRMPAARSIIVAALPYETEARSPIPAGPGSAGRIARYTWTDHYERLAAILAELAQPLERAGHRCQVLIDTNHMVDRHVAWRAGIGWYGKNANLLIPGLGSWFVLGSILTEAELEQTDHPLDDGCGPCQRCIDDCPTDAIVAPGVVDARRCIAWLVQAGEAIPVEFRAAVADRMYGCDDCQEVCPPNRSRDPLYAESEPRVDPCWVLTASDDEILAEVGRWYIADRNVDVVRRTALVVLGNTAEPSWGPDLVVGLVTRYVAADDHPLLRNHAVWAARRLGLAGSAAAGAAVDLPVCCSDDAVVCQDPELHAELAAPVDARFDHSAWTTTGQSAEGRS